MEKDDEIKGEGNSYDFGARMLDPRVGRFFALDPLDSKTPDTSGYSVSGDSPIYKIDENGEIEIIIHVYKKHKGKYYKSATYKMDIKTDEDIKGITRNTMHINAFADFQQVSGSSSYDIFKGIKKYKIREKTGLNEGEQLKEDNPLVYYLGQFMLNNPLGTGKVVQAMNGKDVMSGENLDTTGKAIKYTEALLSVISLGRASSTSEFMKDWAKDFVVEEGLKKLFSSETFEDNSELMQKATMFAYQTYKLTKLERADLFETINSITSRQIKGKELLDEILKKTGVDLTAPADKFEAAKKAIQIMNSEAQK
jgi:hypothetical protein